MDKKFLKLIGLSFFILLGLIGNGYTKYPGPITLPTPAELIAAEKDCNSSEPDCALFELWSVPAYEACSMQHCEKAMALLKKTLGSFTQSSKHGEG